MEKVEEKILVGVDGSEQSERALEYAVHEAKEKGLSKITIVHSRKDSELESDGLMEIANSIEESENISVEPIFLSDDLDVPVSIVKFAEENDFNHIVVGSHGRSGINRILLGSVAEGVIKKAHCVVTVVRAEHARLFWSERIDMTSEEGR